MIFGILILLVGLGLVLFADKLSTILLYRYKKPGFYVGPYRIGKKNGKLGATYAQNMSEALGQKKAVWIIRSIGILSIVLSIFVLSGILKMS